MEFIESISIGQRIRYALQHNDGRIVLWTDSNLLVFLEKGEADPTSVFVENFIDGLDVEPEIKSTITATLEECQNCHSLTPDEHRAGPALGQIAGRPFGSTKFANYSNAIQATDGIWDRDTLIAFLKDSQSVVPGTVMPSPQMENNETTEAIADLLVALVHYD